MKPKNKKFQIHPYIDQSLKKELEALANARRVSQSEIVEAAIEAYLHPDQYAPDPDGYRLILRRLDRLYGAEHLTLQYLEVAAEAIAMFVRIWLTSTPTVPKDQEQDARIRGGKRYRAYIEQISNRLRRGNSVFSDLPEDLFASLEANTSDEPSTPKSEETTHERPTS